jgi:hypothetical protein
MPTRYTLELEGLKGTVTNDTFKEVSQRENMCISWAKRTQGSEEPTVLSAGVTVLKGLLDGLLATT